MLSFPQLYSQQQLQRIDALIEENMNNHLETLLSNKIQSMLQEQMMKYQHVTSNFRSDSYEENVCHLFNCLSETYMKKQEVYIDQIDQGKMEKQQHLLVIRNKQEIIQKQKQEINRLSSQLLKQNKEKHQLNSKIFIISQQLHRFKQTLMNELSAKQNICQNLQAKINELYASLKDQILKNEQLIFQNTKFKQQKGNYERQFQQLQQCLCQDIQKYQLNIITNNILIHQLNQTYEEKMKEFNKYAKIHMENRQLVSIIQVISKSLQVSLIQIEKYDSQSNNLAICQEDFFQQLKGDFQIIAQRLSKYSQACFKLSKTNQQMKKTIKQKQQQIIQLKSKQTKLLQSLQTYKNENQYLKEHMCKTNSQHYSILIDVQKNKRKIQESLLQNLQELKKMHEKYMLIDLQNRQKQQKIHQLSSKLSITEQQKQSLQEQGKQKQKIIFQLKEQILNIKSNLDIMMKTQEDDQDCNFNIVQQLIDKNNELNNQMSTKKMQIDLKQQKIVYQQKIIEQYVQEIQNLTHQNQRLNDNFKQLQMELQIQQQECKNSHQHIEQLDRQIEQFKLKEAEKAKKKFTEAQVQTDQIHHTVQSRIKKQIITQPQKTQVDKSHSLLSQRNQSKQNISSKGNLMSTRQKQNYKQKIVTLNELINYMLNYAKGYQCGEIRLGSWFSNQIQKYGTQYEQRILDPIHLQPKIKNMKFIEKLCKQDTTCNRLIKQFQTIMQFYFNRTSKLSASSLSITPITQQKLNKTVNKSRIPLNKYNF